VAKNKEISIEVNNLPGGTEVLVTIPHYDPRSIPAMTFRTRDVIAYLKKEDIKHGSPTEEAYLNNMPPETTLEGRWVFKKPVKPRKKKTTNKNLKTKRK
tara:strand:- start:347 stop:643 length:297 start_codon:yes stop_codon:yes gene_type:complete